MYEKLVVNCSLVVHNYVSSVMRSAFADILVPTVPLDFMPTIAPKTMKFCVHNLYFNSKRSYQIASMFDM